MKLLLILAVASWTLAANAPAALLRGSVRLENAPVPGVTLTVSDQGKVVGEVVTDSAGQYAVSLPSGRHLLTARLEGLKAIRRELCVSGDARYDVLMSLDVTSHSVTVTTHLDQARPIPRRLRGRVVNHMRTPIPGAFVRVHSRPIARLQRREDGTWDHVEITGVKSVSVRTDASGEFSLELSTASETRMTVTTPGYQDEDFILGSSPESSYEIALLPSCV